MKNTLSLPRSADGRQQETCPEHSFVEAEPHRESACLPSGQTMAFPMHLHPKVFGIGLSRTGTTSLARALHLLGYRSQHFPHDDITRPEVYHALVCRPVAVTLSVLDHVDAIADIPVCCLYQALDQAYPGSKFILTVREKQTWLSSCQALWHRKLEPAARLVPDAPKIQYFRALSQHLYGTFAYDEQRFERAYDHYTQEVQAYFQGRETDLLLLDICSGQGWKQLAPFLDMPVPEIPFPFLNQRRPGEGNTTR